MKSFTCRSCGAELLPDTRFCRKCGAAISGDDFVEGSEEPTTLLRQPQGIVTEHLSSRSTAEQGNVRLPEERPIAETSPAPRTVLWWRGLLIGAAVIVLILAIASAVAVVKLHSKTVSDKSLIYPGSTVVMSVGGGSGGQAFQLKTGDPLGTVSAWYEKTLKPDKVLRITSSTVVMKNDKATATIVGTENGTQVVIKVTP